MKKISPAVFTLVFPALLVLLALPAVPAGAGDRPEAAVADQAAAVAGNNAFALEMYAQLRGQKGNLFFSPYSISVALAMTYGGARGNTAAQMERVLHFTLPANRLHAAQGALVRSLNDPARESSYELAVANSLWGERSYEFLPRFLALNADQYGAPLHEVDFIGNFEGARQEINTWVEERTKEKIPDLIPPGGVDALSRLVLVNAIYFKGNWARQFEEERTRDQPFHLAGGGQVTAPLMNQKSNFRYAEDERLQALALPYVGDELEMVVLLPREADGLAALEAGLTPEMLAGWINRLGRERPVVVFLPRFRLEPDTLEMTPLFQALGMTDAFQAPPADFSGISGGRDLYIKAIFHKAFVDVNEEGTEAAAATAVVVGVRSAGRPRPTPVFRADRPFLFLIRERASGSILFLGRLTSPAPAE